MKNKRIKKAYASIDKNKVYTLPEAISLLKAASAVKFDETIEVSMNLSIDPKKADQNVRGVVQLPHGTGKVCRVAVFARGPKAEEAKAAGADIVGAEELQAQIEKGEILFDRCVATPDMMGVVGRVARILGPRGLMPNPKLGTVTMDVKAVVDSLKAGQVEYRSEKAGIIHSGVGKVSFDAEKIEENVKTFVNAIVKARPSGVKGSYVKKMSLSSTMGPGVSFSLEA